MNYALGWACNLNDIFVRFPYEKYKSLMTKWKTKLLRLKIVKQVFRASIPLILNDIIENNATFKLPSMIYSGGEMHLEAIKGSEFERARKNGKFRDIDFLESLFTGYLMYIYIHGKRDNFLAGRKYPVYIGNLFKDKLTKNVNRGKQYA